MIAPRLAAIFASAGRVCWFASAAFRRTDGRASSIEISALAPSFSRDEARRNRFAGIKQTDLWNKNTPEKETERESESFA